MTDRDTTPAERVQAYVTAYLEAWRTEEDEVDILDSILSDELRLTDLRTVLAEHQAMREQLAALTVVWESVYSEEEYETKAEALVAASADLCRPATDEDVMRRLVGEWQPADDGITTEHANEGTAQ